MTKILLVDHSGRGHAFADLFSRTNKDAVVYYAPGCSAIKTDRVVSVPELTLADPVPMAEFAKNHGIDFVFVANTMALAKGFVDVFREHGLPVIGPDRQASQLEASKIFGKRLCAKHGLPVADFAFFDNPDSAKSYVKSVPYQVVVKADGLCGGNGSFVCDTVEDAFRAIDKLMVERFFEEAGDRVVIEKRLFGRELSFFAILDANGYLILPMALDYPKSDDGNTGITCGGVGAISPHPLESESLTRNFENNILIPLAKAIRVEGLNYNGVIYIGSMLVGDKLHILEINVRMGDPEAEVILPRIENDFVSVCQSILSNTLDAQTMKVNDLFFCDIVGTQGKTRQVSKGRSKGWYVGWPYGRFGKHYKITGVEQVDETECRLFIGEASVLPEKGLASDGGRVIHAVGFADTLEKAVDNAYRNIERIEFSGMRYRTDIGKILPWENM